MPEIPLSDLFGADPYTALTPGGEDITRRPGQAVQQLVDWNLPGAWNAMLAPEKLTPAERDRFLRKQGLIGGPFESVFRVMSNPAMIASLILAYKFPVPNAKNLFKFSKRISGLQAKFPFLGRITSSWTIFRGTDVPNAIGDITRTVVRFKDKYGIRWREGLAEFQQVTGRSPNLREQVMLSSWLDGLHKSVRGFKEVGPLMPTLEQHMSPALLKLGHSNRAVLNEMWKETFEGVTNRKAILKAYARQKKMGLEDDTLDQFIEFVRNPKKVPDYFPHRALKSEEEFRALMQTLVQGTGQRIQSAATRKKALQWLGPEFQRRKHAMLPSLEDLNEIKDVVDQGALRKMQGTVRDNLLKAARKAGIREQVVGKLEDLPLNRLMTEYPKWLQGEEARKFAHILADNPPKQYSLKLRPVLDNYTHTMATTQAWTIKGGGERMVAALDEAKALAATGNPHAKVRAEMLENTYIPMTMGRQSFRQVIRGQMWDQEMTKLALRLDNPTMKGLLGEKMTGYLRDSLKQSRGALSLNNLMRKAAGYFYINALGINVASSFKNLLQVVLTTGPSVGYRTAARGMERAFQKSHRYFALRFGTKKLDHLSALKAAYPEFAEAGLAGSPITDEVLENALQNAYNLQNLAVGKTAKTAEKIGRSMMSIFSASEHAVRLATFEAGMLHASRVKLPMNAAISFSRELVERTQFTFGVHNTPYFLLDKGPLFRQFLNFPTKMLEFVSQTALRMGSGAIDPKTGLEKSWLGYNPGTVARLIAGSVIALELGDAVGIDAGDALIGGALPGFTEAGKPFAPLPLVPPAIQLAGAAAMGLGTGDFSELLHSTPLLVPGGVQLYRSMGLLPPGIPGGEMGRKAAQWAERTYADYEQPAPDGRIAVFSGKGVLKGYYTPWELVRAGLGIKGREMQTEEELVRMLVTNRDQIREYRREFLDKLFTNNPKGASDVQKEFKGRFGFELPVSERDLEAMQARRRMTRMEQVFRTLPPGPAREHFGRLIESALGTEGAGLLGIEPSLLGAPKPVRERARGRVTRPGPYLNRMGPTEAVNPATIGRQPYPQVSRFGF